MLERVLVSCRPRQNVFARPGAIADIHGDAASVDSIAFDPKATSRSTCALSVDSIDAHIKMNVLETQPGGMAMIANSRTFILYVVIVVPIVNVIRWRGRTNRAMLPPDVRWLQIDLVTADRIISIESEA